MKKVIAFLKKLGYELIVWGKPLLKAKLKAELEPIIEAELTKVGISKKSALEVSSALLKKIKEII